VYKILFLTISAIVVLLVFITRKTPRKKIFIINFIFASIILASMIIFFLKSNEYNIGKKYYPPVYKEGVIKPGFFSEENN